MSDKVFTVDQFLGLNEAADGSTELKMGEASKMENFLVTDDYNLKLRPGIRRVAFENDRAPAPILAMWSGFVGSQEYLILCDFWEGTDRLVIFQKHQKDGQLYQVVHSQSGALGLTQPEGAMVKIFSFAENLFVMSRGNTVVYREGGFVPAEIYVPLVIAGASPGGGGTTLENINLLTPLRRVDYSADGTTAAFVLPGEAQAIVRVLVDNAAQDPSLAGVWDDAAHTYTFHSPPEKGVGNVELTYRADPAASEKSRLTIAKCTLAETYNGSTDTRLFLAGDGSNRCYYSGVPQSGDLSQLYFPAMSDVAVDMSDSPVTGMVRSGSKLLVFKPDSAYSISYEPVTLVDGSTTAGFYLRNVSRNVGNEAPGQIQTVNNIVRSVSHGGVYEWRFASYYRDERNANRVSDMVGRTLAGADLSKVVTCDNNFDKTYYVFLNDQEGTVLVNRYDLGREGVWCVYRSNLLKGVKGAVIYGGTMVFYNGQEAFWFSQNDTTDAPLAPGGAAQQIFALWESGHMHFGADFRRKYSSLIYISLKPEGLSELTVTASTDRREEYMEKKVSSNLFSWHTVTFPDWTFNLNDTPKINRVRLKVKKFVYYKLIFKVEKFGATATVLSYDQQVRFSSMAK